jgi:Domain of unknown function (DUF4365)
VTDEHRMEQLSRAYVQAVAAVCGCRWAAPVPDYGIDGALRRVTRQHGRWREVGPAVYVQLKATAVPARVTAASIAYDLDVPAYDLLRRATRTSPALLVLMVLPPDRSDWLGHSESQLEIRRCAYYLSLRRWPAVSNTTTTRVEVPRRNQFTPTALLQIMAAFQRREDV